MADLNEPVASTRETRCCVVGAGPAGAMLSLLLARAGVPVTLLEAHHDFDRDFRGDTVHPSTLDILAQLGLAERIHQLPHGKIRTFQMRTPGATVTMANLGRLGVPYPYVMVLPQARLLQLLVEEAKKFPTFQVVLGANVQRLIREGDAVRGVAYRGDDGQWHAVRADLTVAADGRFSKLRHLAGVEPVKTSPPMDVLWFRLPRRPNETDENITIYAGGGRFCVVFDRGDQWQIGYVILKGSFSAVREAGLPALRASLAEKVPWLADRVEELRDWKQIAVLNVESSRVPKWYLPGLLLLGDAAHVMSPVAGVGINYAVQDAVEAANMLADKLRAGAVTEADLAAVQARREFPVKVIQRVQRLIQDRIVATGVDATKAFKLPWFVRLITSVPLLRNLPARMLAYGVRKVRVSDAILQHKP